MEKRIRTWYIKKYPEDTIGREINRNVRFSDLLYGLNNNYDVYKLLGVLDSIVRERVFERLSELLEVPYDYVYKKWLYNS